MDLDAIETGAFRVLCAGAELLNNAGDLVELECTRGHPLLVAGWRDHFAAG